MGIIITLIIGGIVGWLAAKIAGRDEGIIASVVIGVVGSFIGSFISAMLSGADRASLSFSWPGLVWSLIGSVILVVILNMVQHRSKSNI